MKTFSSSLFFILFSFSVTAQYQVGVFVYDTIYSGGFHRLDDCNPEEDVNIGLDQEVLGFVAGLELIMIINEINVPQGSVATTSGELSANDSLALNSNTTFYPFFFSAKGSFKFSIIAKGIPQIENQMYPCFFTEFITQVHCENGYIITPDPFFDNCFVQEGVITNTSEPLKQKDQISIFPNPANSSVNIHFSHPNTLIHSLEIFNSTGINITSFQNISSNENLSLDVSNLNPGVYFIKISSDRSSSLETLIIH